MDNFEQRLTLHAKLKTLFPNYKLYFRPPNTIKLEYPCIVYDLAMQEPRHANNTLYTLYLEFEITIISVLPGVTSSDILTIPSSRQQSHFISNNLVHDVYKVRMT